jgi:hypothetical protein
VTFKQFSIDTSADMELYLQDVFVSTWNEDDDPTVAPIIGPFNKIKVYQDNVDKLLTDFVEAEKPYLSDNSDIIDNNTSIYLFNMLTGVTSRNAPYYAFQINNYSIKFNQNYTIWATGGGDGTMSLTNFSKSVGNKVTEYLDPNSLLQQSAYHCETFIHDSGFALEDKYKLLAFISRRKDTGVILSTYTVGGRELSVGEESSIGRALSIREDVGKVIQNGDGYDSIEELIASVPLTKFAYASLPRRIAIDFGLIYGVDYPELSIVAYTGAFETMRPIASYVYNGSMKYIKHPQFDWMVQRYK